MPHSARRDRNGAPGTRPLRLVIAGMLALAGAMALAACGSSPRTSATPSASAKPSASSTPQVVGSQRTVLSPLGLNIHSDPAASASVVATAAQGVTLSVLDYRSANGGWFKVQGASTTGWIVADPSLTAQGVFTPYSSDARQFAVLIPQTWTFAEETTDVVFRPQQGEQTIAVRNAANRGALGPEEPPGYVSSSSQQEVVCGYTGQLDFYSSGGTTQAPASATPTASPGSAARHLANYAAIRLVFDSTHTLEIAFNYTSRDQLGVFEDFYNSITFPFPQCQAPAPTPAPVPPA